MFFTLDLISQKNYLHRQFLYKNVLQMSRLNNGGNGVHVVLRIDGGVFNDDAVGLDVLKWLK